MSPGSIRLIGLYQELVGAWQGFCRGNKNAGEPPFVVRLAHVVAIRGLPERTDPRNESKSLYQGSLT